jgi:putative ABC transport system permease protein
MFRRVAAMWRARRAEAELAEEIESHRQLIEQRLRESGISAAEAASASRRAMGNVTLAREDARSEVIAPWIDSVGQDVAYAFRLLRRAPGFSAAMILVMAIGIGAATAIFGLIDRLVLKSLPVRDPQRLVYFDTPSFSYPIFQEVCAGAAPARSPVSWPGTWIG